MHVMTALIAGNAVVLKPSEHTPECGAFLVRLLHEAGVPDAIVSLLPGDGRVGAALVSTNIDKVFFTGSERTGRMSASVCAPRFLPVSLELGGSDAAVVLEDADMPTAASGILWGRFANAADVRRGEAGHRRRSGVRSPGAVARERIAAACGRRAHHGVLAGD